MDGADTRRQDSFELQAARLGVTPQGLLLRLRENRWRSEVASNDCLSLEEIEDYCEGTLDESRRMHLDACAECRGIVAATMPTQENAWRALQKILRLGRIALGFVGSVTLVAKRAKKHDH